VRRRRERVSLGDGVSCSFFVLAPPEWPARRRWSPIRSTMSVKDGFGHGEILRIPGEVVGGRSRRVPQPAFIVVVVVDESFEGGSALAEGCSAKDGIVTSVVTDTGSSLRER